MARKKVIELSADTTIEWDAPGRKIEGYYLGYKTVNGEYGPCRLHCFANDAGSVGGWGKTQLDKLLETVEVGCMSWVEFTGRGPKTKGKQPAYLFSVEWDDEDKIDTSTIVTQYNKDAKADAEETEEETSEDESQDAGDEPDEDDEAETEKNPAAEVQTKKGAPTGPTAEQKSKAANMVNKIKAKTAGKPAAAA